MPPEFIDNTLKGAEAVAYKLVQEGAENCGFGGNKLACSRRTAHGFEIYYKSSLQLPHATDTKYNYRALYMLPTSKHLLSSHSTRTPSEAAAYMSARPGAQARFATEGGWGLVGIKGTKPVWPITALRETQYIEELLPGYNYLSVEGSMGFFTNPRFEKLGVTQFVVRLDKLDDKRDDEAKDVRTDYGHIIYLPTNFISKIRQIDKQGDEAFRRLLKEALPEVQRETR